MTIVERPVRAAKVDDPPPSLTPKQCRVLDRQILVSDHDVRSWPPPDRRPLPNHERSSNSRQLFDRTKARPATFFGDGIVGHVAFADPFCGDLSRRIAAECQVTGTRHHVGGTYVCIEGPQFSTKAESRIYRSWGVDVIGMTAIPEAKLAREAEICYAMIALVTDYDVWHESAGQVTVEIVVANLHQNVKTATAIVRSLLANLTSSRQCSCESALANAIMTAPEMISSARREALAPIIAKYIGSC